MDIFKGFNIPSCHGNANKIYNKILLSHSYEKDHYQKSKWVHAAWNVMEGNICPLFMVVATSIPAEISIKMAQTELP